MARRLEIKLDSGHYEWIEQELRARFDLACCDSAEQFRREARAITRAGQIKDPGGRHEKNDQYLISDRSRYVLGWSNADKLRTLAAKRDLLEQQVAGTGARISRLQKDRKELQQKLEALAGLQGFATFAELDWMSLVREIESHRDEHAALTKASNTLQELATQLETASQALQDTEARLDGVDGADGARDQRSKADQRRLDAQPCASKRCCCGRPCLWPTKCSSGWQRSGSKRSANTSCPWSPATTGSRTCALAAGASMPRTGNSNGWPRASSGP